VKVKKGPRNGAHHISAILCLLDVLPPCCPPTDTSSHTNAHDFGTCAPAGELELGSTLELAPNNHVPRFAAFNYRFALRTLWPNRGFANRRSLA
jgi:hypothetical protein